ncbi:MAG: hypothetical protein JW731_09585 [Bacteroidales bacterium]|nr:hypothetical protein [Bacteroidales bacterium]
MLRICLASLILILSFQEVQSQVHTTYLWHLQQPIYWPEQSQWNPYHYQTVWESQYHKDHNGNWYPDGLQHPLNDLQEIFNKDDRKAVYQWRTKDAVQSLLGFPEAGAQVNYSGCLIENVNSLANASQWGYSNGWENNYITARNWQTSGGNPRMDVVGFTFHHALSPLLSERVLRKEIQAHRHIYNQTFGTNPDYSKGYWPAECSFSVRILKVLVEEGFEWSVIANSHLARTLADYPLNFGTSGCNIDPPNGADITSFAGTNWWSGQIDGRGGSFAAPFCYQAHKAKYVDPETGFEYIITVVPMADLLSYQNGYALMGTGDIDAHIAPYNDPSHPSIVLMAHDGDNAWGGGYDYYNNSVPGFASAAASQGYVPTTIQQFLDDHPVSENDIVHVEDGSWFNAENDWGHPQFINWLWPIYTQNYEFDPNGWTEDARNWAVLVAAENRVCMAEDLSGGSDIGDIVFPNASSTLAERAWHHLLPGYTSGYMYYGTSLDMEVKQTLAANLACDLADQVIADNPGTDHTPPTVFIPQRYPYNPGGTGFGPTYGYQQHPNSSDFTVWTFAYDVSGLQTIVLKYRLDNDGINPLTDNENDTYAGGPGVQNWNSISMTERIFPTGNVTGNPDINFFILPDYIANEYYAEITGLSDTLVDYYIEATDTYGNVFRTPIQHVYVGNYNPGGSGSYSVSWEPEEPEIEDMITLTVANPNSVPRLHWGVNYSGSNWQTPDNAYWPDGTYLFNGSGPAAETPFNGPDAENNYTLEIGPFNDPAQTVNSIAFVIHFENDTWDNNNGSDYHIDFGGQGIVGVQWEPQNPTQFDSVRIYVGQANIGAKLHWGVKLNGSNWQTPHIVYWPTGSYLFNGSGPAIESAFDGPDSENILSLVIGPFDDPIQEPEGINFVIHYDNNTWDNNNGNDYFIPIIYISPIELDVKVFLEGPFNGTTMNTDLTNSTNSTNFPTIQPYNISPWNYNETESITEIPAGTVDWILIELRDASGAPSAISSTMIARKAAFLMSDGHIRSLDGATNQQFIDLTIQQSLFVVIHHRNHLSIMSANPLTGTEDVYSYDFTIAEDQAYNSGQKNLGNGYYGMYAADGDADGIIDNDDHYPVWTNDAGNWGYLPGDYNLDSQVDNEDKNNFWFPNKGAGSHIPEL